MSTSKQSPQSTIDHITEVNQSSPSFAIEVAKEVEKSPENPQTLEEKVNTWTKESSDGIFESFKKKSIIGKIGTLAIGGILVYAAAKIVKKIAGVVKEGIGSIMDIASKFIPGFDFLRNSTMAKTLAVLLGGGALGKLIIGKLIASKTNPGELAEAMKGGKEGIAKMIFKKHQDGDIELTGEEKKGLAGILGVPSFGKIGAYMKGKFKKKETKEESEEASQSSEETIESNEVAPKYPFETGRMGDEDVWGAYVKTLDDIKLELIMKWEQIPDTIKVGAAFIGLAHIEEVIGILKGTGKFTKEKLIKLAKFSKHHPFFAIFSVGAAIAVYNKGKTAMGDMIVPKDPNDLDEFLAINAKHGLAEAGETFKSIPGITEGTEVLKKVLDGAYDLTAEIADLAGTSLGFLWSMVEMGGTKFGLTQEEVVAESYSAGYNMLKKIVENRLKYIDDKNKLEMFRNYIDTLISKLEGGNLISHQDYLKLKGLGEDTNLFEFIEDKNYIKYNVKNKEGKIDKSYMLSINHDNKSLAEQYDLAKTFTFDNSALKGSGDIPLNQFRMFLANTFESGERKENYDSIVKMIRDDGWLLATDGFMLTLVAGTAKGVAERIVLGPLTLGEGLLDWLTGEFSLAEFSYNYTQGIFPVIIIGAPKYIANIKHIHKAGFKGHLKSFKDILIYPYKGSRDLFLLMQRSENFKGKFSTYAKSWEHRVKSYKHSQPLIGKGEAISEANRALADINKGLSFLHDHKLGIWSQWGDDYVKKIVNSMMPQNVKFDETQKLDDIIEHLKTKRSLWAQQLELRHVEYHMQKGNNKKAQALLDKLRHDYKNQGFEGIRTLEQVKAKIKNLQSHIKLGKDFDTHSDTSKPAETPEAKHAENLKQTKLKQVDELKKVETLINKGKLKEAKKVYKKITGEVLTISGNTSSRIKKAKLKEKLSNKIDALKNEIKGLSANQSINDLESTTKTHADKLDILKAEKQAEKQFLEDAITQIKNGNYSKAQNLLYNQSSLGRYMFNGKKINVSKANAEMITNILEAQSKQMTSTLKTIDSLELKGKPAKITEFINQEVEIKKYINDIGKYEIIHNDYAKKVTALDRQIGGQVIEYQDKLNEINSDSSIKDKKEAIEKLKNKYQGNINELTLARNQHIASLSNWKAKLKSKFKLRMPNFKKLSRYAIIGAGIAAVYKIMTHDGYKEKEKLNLDAYKPIDLNDIKTGKAGYQSIDDTYIDGVPVHEGEDLSVIKTKMTDYFHNLNSRTYDITIAMFKEGYVKNTPMDKIEKNVDKFTKMHSEVIGQLKKYVTQNKEALLQMFKESNAKEKRIEVNDYCNIEYDEDTNKIYLKYTSEIEYMRGFYNRIDSLKEYGEKGPSTFDQVTDTALYIAPITGTIMDGKDAYNSFARGDIGGGLKSTGWAIVGGLSDAAIATGVLSWAGAGARGIMGVFRGAKAVNKVNKVKKLSKATKFSKLVAFERKHLGKVVLGAAGVDLMRHEYKRIFVGDKDETYIIN